MPVYPGIEMRFIPEARLDSLPNYLHDRLASPPTPGGSKTAAPGFLLDQQLRTLGIVVRLAWVSMPAAVQLNP